MKKKKKKMECLEGQIKKRGTLRDTVFITLLNN